jgi:hypothetical protein
MIVRTILTCVAYLRFNLNLTGALTRKGGEDEGQGWNLCGGSLSRKTYPRVTFGLHHDSTYDFLCFHVFTELTTANTMWLILVGVVVTFAEVVALLGESGGHLSLKRANLFEDWLQ